MADGRMLGAFVKIATIASIFSLFALAARSQGIAYTAPQGYTAFPFTNTACTGSAQNSAILTNNNQTEHYITLTTPTPPLGIRATVQGSHDGITFNDISDVATQTGSTVMGQGYYPITRVQVTCATAAGTFTVQYSGEATAPAPQIGAMISSQSDKTIGVAVPAGSNFTSQTIRAPFGNTGGGIYFAYAAAGPAGSTLNVGCGTLALGTSTFVASFPLLTTTPTQFFPVPLLPCDFVTIFYNAGAASATTFTSSYVFNPITITGGDPCQGATAPKTSVAINATAVQQLVGGLSNHKIFGCGYDFTIGGNANATAQFEFGTNANCAAGTTTITGAFAGGSPAIHIVAGGGYAVFTVPAGDFLCILPGGTTPSVQGILTFIQQ